MNKTQLLLFLIFSLPLFFVLINKIKLFFAYHKPRPYKTSNKPHQETKKVTNHYTGENNPHQLSLLETIKIRFTPPIGIFTSALYEERKELIEHMLALEEEPAYQRLGFWQRLTIASKSLAGKNRGHRIK